MFKAKNHRFGFFIGDMMYQFLSQALLKVEFYVLYVVATFLCVVAAFPLQAGASIRACQ